MRKLFYVNCFISIVFTAAAQERIADPRITFANTITAEELKEHLYILASEKLEGREAGEQGQKLAAEYMRNYFESIGIPPVPAFNSYYQTFDLWQSGWGEMYMTAGENKYTFIRDFYAYPNSGKAADINTNEVLFLGYGIDDTMYSDYANVDVKDKVILVLKGEPVMNGRSVITGTGDLSAWSSDWKRKIEMATEKGVKAILLVDDNIDKVVTNKYLVEYLRGTSLKLPADVKPVTYCSYAFISPQIANDLFSAKKLEKAKRKIANATPAHFTAKTNLHYTFEKIEQIITTENVLAYIEGGELKEELIVVSAHYDHLGIHGDAIYYGADDDGSGTVGLLELAEALMEAKKAGFTLKRSVLFIGFTAEEKGLYGSEYYASDPVFP
ncbi:MAG: M28 family peptidase, partial [Chitinophagales bacterium]